MTNPDDPSVQSTGLTRRDVLRGLGGLAVASSTSLFARSARAGGTHSTIAAVPNLAYPVPEVEAYAQKSLHAGETIGFRVSSGVPYQLSIERLGWDLDSPAKDWMIHAFPPSPATPQVVRPGSYVHVEESLGSSTPLPQLTLECWVRFFRTNVYQGLITQYGYSSEAGFGLFLSNAGTPVCYFGNGGAFNASWLSSAPTAIPPLTWVHLCAVFDSGSAVLYVDGQQVLTATGLPAAVTPGPQPLRLGAYGEADFTSHFLAGDLAMPAIYDRALDPAEVADRATTLPAQPAVGSIGCWPLDEESGIDLTDWSGCGRNGVIVNRGTWMIGGPGFDASAVDRFFPYDPDADPNRGHGLRLSRADLYDCGWPVTHAHTLPSELLPGVYVGRIRSGESSVYDVTFVVKRAVSRPVAPILVLCATNTWRAYARTLAGVAPTGGYSFYVDHPGGQPAYYQGENVPWNSSADPDASASPYAYYPPPADYSHLLRAERYAHVWLEMNGYDYDVVADRDLHDDPGMLSQYRVVMIVGHSEYWSREAYQGVRSYLNAGGKVFMASGNTMFWRVSFDDGVMEGRKGPAGESQLGARDHAYVGELYHEHDHQRGGLMREAGHPAWNAIGLESVGYSSTFAPYTVTNEAHPFFETPEDVPVANTHPLGGNFAVGHEWDVRLPSIAGDHSPMAPIDYDPVVLAEGRASGVQVWDYHGNWVTGPSPLLSEIIDWPWTNGGRVFAIGSIAAARAIREDAPMAALARNALHHFGLVSRLDVAAIGQDGQFQTKAHDGNAWRPAPSIWTNAGSGFGHYPPTLVQWAPERLAAMAITTGGDFRYRYFDGSTWQNWLTLGSGFVDRPAAVGWGRNRLHLFARGFDTHLYTNAWDGVSWSGFVSLGSGTVESPTAEWREGNQLAVATLGVSGEVLYKWYANGTWHPTATTFQYLGGSFNQPPSLLRWNGNFLDLFAVDAAGEVFRKHWDGTNWQPSLTGWESLGGDIASRVVAVARGEAGELSLFGIGTDGRLKAKWWDGSGWGPGPSSWQDLGGDLVGDPAAVAHRRVGVRVVATGANGRGQELVWDGTSWSGWQDMGGALRPSPALLSWIGRPDAQAVPVGIASGALLGAGLVAVGRRALARKAERDAER